ncbi:hypothetical protein P153DRAFT_187943 [Dothidotthia symphoricarpi CBS 119687]|uniref:Uncharacterized protein n=1 Tax=Dothidotthia symphoricarpi CBS 119687 TaxID=1392245 RepID=A0A6A6AL30_9PLEO|nr:uncharacterized protein P153DRAFT_187943 [Dothidotthia symphoricarpi CBS 119687]KAF2132276.1 hypothetical protein P153DRAFT_187943 [Dothidotthia symphoricarpi CBS 119687]
MCPCLLDHEVKDILAAVRMRENCVCRRSNSFTLIQSNYLDQVCASSICQWSNIEMPVITSNTNSKTSSVPRNAMFELIETLHKENRLPHADMKEIYLGHAMTRSLGVKQAECRVCTTV